VVDIAHIQIKLISFIADIQSLFSDKQHMIFQKNKVMVLQRIFNVLLISSDDIFIQQ